MAETGTREKRVIASNRKVRHDYEILETIEAGLVLTGTEVKSLRGGKASLVDAYADVDRGEVFLIGVHINPYEMGNRVNHEPRRKRKLLLHRREIDRLRGKIQEKGLTLVPTELYFKGSHVKVLLALVRGKRQYDRRQEIAKRDADREIRRSLRRDVE